MQTTHTISERLRREPAESAPHDRLRSSTPPTGGTVPGPVAAALLAAGVGSTTLGIAVVAVEANPAVEEWATMGTAAGSLTGKALLTMTAFLLAWAGPRTTLGAVSARVIGWTTSVLVAVGVLLTFPPVYGLFHGG
jgi:hypothetical protein